MGISIGASTLFIIVLPIWVIYTAIKIIKSKDNKKREIIKELFGIYIIALIGVTIFPIYIGDYGYTSRLAEKANINLVPFVGYMNNRIYMMSVIRGIGGNLILLMPLVVFMFTLNKKFRTLKSCFLLSLLTSLSIELMQLILNLASLTRSSRTVDIEGIILNTLGGVIAYCIYKYISQYIRK